MPVYVYEPINEKEGCEQCKNGFEVVQSMSEVALSECSCCGTAIHRVIQPVGVACGKKHLLRDDNIKKHGFTKLVNEGGGKFRKI